MLNKTQPLYSESEISKAFKMNADELSRWAAHRRVNFTVIDGKRYFSEDQLKAALLEIGKLHNGAERQDYGFVRHPKRLQSMAKAIEMASESQKRTPEQLKQLKVRGSRTITIPLELTQDILTATIAEPKGFAIRFSDDEGNEYYQPVTIRDGYISESLLRIATEETKTLARLYESPEQLEQTIANAVNIFRGKTSGFHETIRISDGDYLINYEIENSLLFAQSEIMAIANLIF